MNRVELQNGCLTRGHSNLFIPSTLTGSCLQAGKVDEGMLKRNLEQAIDVYIDRVNLCPCGDGVIHLFKGAHYSDYREKLKIFLKGSKRMKTQLQLEEPELFKLFSDVWSVCSRHMVKGYPVQYVYYLICCFKKDCFHPLCQREAGCELSNIQWFPDGPSIEAIPLPVPDPNRQWGNTSCSECKGFCAGHYLKPKESFSSLHFVEPPSVVIQRAFKSEQTDSA